LSPKEAEKYHESGGGFYDWYISQTQQFGQQIKTPHSNSNTTSALRYLTNESMFDLPSSSNNSTGNMYKQLVILNRDDIHRKRIVEIMMKEDFIFLEPSPSDEMITTSLSSGNGSMTSSY
jgi:hypothetical protein